DDGDAARQGRLVRHHGASRGANVQRRRGDGRGGRAVGALPRATGSGPSRHSAHRSFPRPKAVIIPQKLDSRAFSGICTTVAFLPLFVGLEENAWPVSGARGATAAEPAKSRSGFAVGSRGSWAKKAGEADGVYDDAQ